MSWVSMHKVIRQAAQDVEAANPAVPFAYDNLPDPHDGADELWVRFSIQTGDTTSAEASPAAAGGSARQRTVGAAFAQTFSPVETGGTKAQHTLAEAFRSRLSKATLTDDEGNKVRFRPSSVRSLGRTRDDKWWQINVVCPFYYDDAPS